MTAAVDDVTLETVERYYDAVPRSSARAEDVGPFTLFVARQGWAFYGRPRLGLTDDVSADDVHRLRERQRALNLPEAIEWVADLTPTLTVAAAAAGLTVSTHPLMALDGGASVAVPPPPGVVVRRLGADDPDFVHPAAVAHVAFGRPGTAAGIEGVVERDLAAGLTTAPTNEFRRTRVREGLTRTFVARTGEGPVGVGSHQPVGDATELVSIATLPVARRRGIGSALTWALIEDARGLGIRTVFLSAGDEDIARIYARLGFRRIGTACIAEGSD